MSERTIHPMAPLGHEAAVDGEGARLKWPWLALLVLCWVQWSAAWIWPEAPHFADGLPGTIKEKPLASMFQYPLWMVLSVAFAFSLRAYGLTLLRALAPFWLYALALALSTAYSFDVPASLRLTLLWAVSVLSGAVLAAAVPVPAVAKWLVLATGVPMIASLAYTLAVPELASAPYADSHAWRGLFSDKNRFGWIALLAATLAWSLRARIPALLVWTVLPASIACVVLSQSKGALVALVAALGYASLLDWMRRRFTAPAAVAVLATAAVALAYALVELAPALAAALGRDLTFTGRTTIWHTYLTDMLRSPWLGVGPGGYTATTSITLQLAYQLQHLGVILTPHNLFLAVLGDSGFLGLVAVAGMFAYLGLYAAFARPNSCTLAAAAVTMATLVSGMAETQDASVGGPTWFLLALLHVAGLEEDEASATRDAAVPPGDGDRIPS